PAVRRMSAEQFRDALGQVTGVWFPKAQFPLDTKEVRSCLVAADPLAVALGRPNREQVVTSRASAATTLQALELTNGGTLADLLKRGAANLALGKISARELVQRLYEQGLGRKPSSSEARLAGEIVGKPLKKE